MARPKVSTQMQQRVVDVMQSNLEAKPHRIYTEGVRRYGKGGFPGSTSVSRIYHENQAIVGQLVTNKEPPMVRWEDGWGATAFVLTNVIKDVTPRYFRHLTKRQLKWTERLGPLLDLTNRRDLLFLLWFAIRYSEIERLAEAQESEAISVETDWLDRWFMEWTGRQSPRYSEVQVEDTPSEETIAQDIYYYFKNVSEGRGVMWLIERKKPSASAEDLLDHVEEDADAAGSSDSEDEYDWLNIP